LAGQVVGLESEHGAHVWRGLPFSEPPTGDLCWRAAKPLVAWNGIREALNFARSCAQPPSKIGRTNSDGNVSGQEDCLYLDIYALPMSSEHAENARLPVMLWIHGGGNSIGSSSYDSLILAKQENVIVVAVQYRLEPFGWFYQPGLASPQSSHENKSGNYGTLDLIQALQWSKDNIQAFGGNPDNVTIFGESAGGFNVLSLLLSPLADGLFNQAISQSGSVQFTGRLLSGNW
jgi:para-nitrobenzyl esterase